MERDDDDISITSTVQSEMQSEYEIDGILDEKIIDGNLMYLVKWTGYPVERSNLEPAESFFNDTTLREWREKRERVARGEEPPFDTDGLLRRQQETEAATADRKARRKAKRIRLGISVAPKPKPEDTEELDESLSERSSDPGDSTADDDGEESESAEDDDLEMKARRRLHHGRRKQQRASGPACSSSVTAINTTENQVKRSDRIGKSGPSRPKLRETATAQSKDKRTALRVHTNTAKPKLPSSSSKPTSPSKQKTAPKLVLHPLFSTFEKPRRSLANSIRQRQQQQQQQQQQADSTNETATSPTNTHFRKLSTKWRYEKASRAERQPDIHQLDLRRPSDWLYPQEKPNLTFPGARRPEDSLFVEQDSPIHVADDDDPEVRPAAESNVSLTRAAGESHSPNLEQRPEIARSLSRRSSLADTSTHVPSSHPPETDAPMVHPSRQHPSLQRRHSETVPTGPRSLDDTGPTPIAKWTGGGRYWNPGEVLVTMQFGPEEKQIGHVRLCGVNFITKKQLVSLKFAKRLDIHFRDTVTMDEYTQLCNTEQDIFANSFRNGGFPHHGHQPNTKFSSGWVIGFQDTSAAVDDMASFLRDNQLVALFYHPTNPTVLVAYPSGVPGWDFFEQGARVPASANLRFIARSALPPIASLQRAPLPQPQPHGTLGHPSIQTHGIPPVASPDADDDVPMNDAPEPQPPRISIDPATVDLVQVFEKDCGVTWDKLSHVNSEKKRTRARSFYVHFPLEFDAEFQLVMKFLEQFNAATFTNHHEGDWTRFTRTISYGTVLFHQNFINYQDMPGLSFLLRQPVNVFNISLLTPIHGVHPPIHLQQLFPHGAVILMTEDFMIHETKVALEWIQWFGDYSRTKSPGTWKMFFRPNVQRWLLELDNTWPDDRVLRMYHAITNLIPDYPPDHTNSFKREDSPDSLDGLTDSIGQIHPFISPSELANYGFRKETDHPNIPSGLTQEERDTDHLVEYFAGWAVMNAHKFRRFVVLHWGKPQPRWQAWTHIEPMNAREFHRTIVKPNPNKKPSSSKNSHSQSHPSRRSSNSEAPLSSSTGEAPRSTTTSTPGVGGHHSPGTPVTSPP
ncbi:hypothetical protein AJ80_04726 [Polytolypa hystricis UAMH7299]|uniref:Chromo domain-containing protein n=1 Tax=Polytolypa hystricis (strain UAMH7299) TaxID=1447883 RepID=A0A2B7Y9X1_POLH7|nr:hypothetical protein AJ80_04726 [Polytolypa hystricis UAMH7299]